MALIFSCGFLLATVGGTEHYFRQSLNVRNLGQETNIASVNGDELIFAFENSLPDSQMYAQWY